jgi:hypothetical protein
MAVSLVQLVSYSSPALRRRDSLLREHCAVNERVSKPKMEIPEWLMWLRAEEGSVYTPVHRRPCSHSSEREAARRAKWRAQRRAC